MDHARSMEEQRIRMESADERLEQITVKLDRIADLLLPGSIFRRSLIVMTDGRRSGRKR
jgi:hypothetical protein